MRVLSTGLGAFLICLSLCVAPAAQGLTGSDADTVRVWLREAYEFVKKNYYDPKYHGVDWDARYKEYQDKLKTAASLNAGTTLVAAFLDGLHDSHTYFSPPPRSYTFEYGYRLALFGDRVFI